jgi:hypothetical protein
MSSARRAAVLAAALILSPGGAAALSSPAHAAPAHISAPAPDSAGQAPNQAAATGYTYWGYYVWNTEKAAWDYMTVGANDSSKLPADGDVYGFRWALVVQEPRLPRAEPDFEEICAETPQPEKGEKRVGFVLDYGAEVDAPEGEAPPEPRGACALVSDDFTVQQALQTVAEVRVGKDGRICGVDAYPATGCGDVIKDAEEGPPDQPVALALPADLTEPDDTESAGGETDAAADSADSDSGDGGFWGIAVAGLVVVALAFGALLLRRRQS